MKVAKRNTRLKFQRKQGDRGKNVDYFWQNQIATYLLFVMQKTRFIQLKTSHKDNFLFQCDYNDVTLSQILDLKEEEAFNKLQYWILIPRLTKSQMLLLVRDQKIKRPQQCYKSRKVLCDLLLMKYSHWEKVLKDKNTNNNDLLQCFLNFQPFSTNSEEANKELKNKIRVLIHGAEIIIMWITTNKEFCPIKKQVPLPHSRRL